MIDVLPSGAIILGPCIVADGFEDGRAFRIQTHLHSDHMRGFSSSLRKDVVLTPELRDLLAMKYPQLSCRSSVTGVHTPACGQPYVVEDPRSGAEFTITQEYAGHMLGAAQCSVRLPDGTTVGYSGDFSWPLDRVIKVDQLVVDATYGDPESRRDFNQDQAEEELVELISEKSKSGGGVELIARPGIAERALMIISLHDLEREGDVSVIASSPICHFARVYRKYELPMISNLLENGSDEALAAVESGRYIRIWDTTGGGSLVGARGFKLKLEMTFRGHEEVSASSRTGITTVGISSHAGHDQTLEYIKQSGASVVVTDARRAGPGKARKLAEVVRRDLGVRAYHRGSGETDAVAA